VLIPLVVAETNAISTDPAPSIAMIPIATKAKTTLSDKVIVNVLHARGLLKLNSLVAASRHQTVKLFSGVSLRLDKTPWSSTLRRIMAKGA
jgi:hypothetical protein